MDNEILLKESIKEFGRGYLTPTILEDIKHEEPVFIQEEFLIPERYNQTKVTFLSVDPVVQFIYWDIEDSLYEKLINYDKQIRVFIKDEEKVVINVEEKYGKHYFKLHAPFEEAFCILGYKKDSKFIQIAKSNIFILPSDTVFEGEEVFVSKEDFKNKDKIKKILDKIKVSKGTKISLTEIGGSSNFL